MQTEGKKKTALAKESQALTHSMVLYQFNQFVGHASQGV